MSRVEVYDVFRMSVIEALLEMRRHSNQTDLTPPQLVSLLRAQGATQSLGWSDAEAAIEDCPEILTFPARDSHVEIRTILGMFIRFYRPLWMRNIPRGRRHLTNAPRTAVQCLEQARLMKGHSEDVLDWWDSISFFVREIRGETTRDSGRKGESWSLSHELKRLNADPNSPTLIPEIVSLDDNTLGYDIRSFLEQDTPERLFIEVKASAQGHNFFLTRNEWNVCQKNWDRFLLHHWIIPQKRLNVYRPEDLEQHVPEDRGTGQWTGIQITGLP